MQGSKRWIILIVVTLLFTGVAFFAFMYAADQFGVSASDAVYFPWWLGIGISALVFTGSQVIFVLPMVKPPVGSTKGTSLKWSICIAGMMGAILTVTFGMMIASVVTTLLSQTPSGDEWAMLPAFFSGWWAWPSGEMQYLFIELGVLTLSWIIWSLLLWTYVSRRHRDPGTLVRLTGWLFAGSLVEVLLSIPLSIMVDRRSDCTCATGAFGALVMSVMACLWLLGPGIVIVIFWRKRPWMKDHCSKCGYPLKVPAATVCSECGANLTTSQKRATDGI